MPPRNGRKHHHVNIANAPLVIDCGCLAELRRRRSRVIEQDHTVILGWNRAIFTVLTELVEANASRRRAVVVVMAERTCRFLNRGLKSLELLVACNPCLDHSN